jgi:hypothetical protein
MGFNCDICKDGFYNFSALNPLGCIKCDCDLNATLLIDSNSTSLIPRCSNITGQCECKTEFIKGAKCDKCIESMYNLESGCQFQCNCDPFGSLGAECDQISGQCNSLFLNQDIYHLLNLSVFFTSTPSLKSRCRGYRFGRY